MRPIDADLLKDSLRSLEARGTNINYVKGLQDAIDEYLPHIIDCAPTIDVEPVKHARWETGTFYRRCTACGADYDSEKEPPYCEICGAIMDGGAENV